LLSIAGGSDLGLFEVSEAAELVAASAHPDANIIYGTVIDDALGDEVRVTVIAAGFDGGQPKRKEMPLHVGVDETGSAQEHAPILVAASVLPDAPPAEATTRRTIVFDDQLGSEELDIPDFLK
jgi:cell division protein FtsZ